jgi:hypothetical protein
MPFRKIGKNRYRHGSRTYTGRQVRAYYATKGFQRRPRKRGKKR